MLFYDSIEIAPSNVMVLHIVAKFATKRNYEFDVDYDARVARLILSSVRERERVGGAEAVLLPSLQLIFHLHYLPQELFY